MGTPVIELDGLARTYPGPPPVPALRPADLVIEAGGYVAVTGPSGSGCWTPRPPAVTCSTAWTPRR
jgi:ABC-type Fe3+/spermidine/putrescine transport system ATPase subunit